MGRISPWEASSFGYFRVLGVLLADVDKEVNEKHLRGWTCLHIAAWNGHVRVVEVLLGAGADKSLLTYDGRSALALAETRGHREVADLLR